ncbi:short-chain dehydrogenase [Streptomyces antimycoticus]|uniref:Short-chain dehydrogenase n=1 Tax=Streptomyces antimycoticus TaxID=68175 RepID=A0A499US69_9ACTN|nr:SDR family oxidoreductase [Streptomyces antimycoticus]BBJ43490.1 short-chain dehydrogenase [Streptomyces antimycoticus]
MDIKNSIALVTGANRGFGRHLAEQLLSRGAAKVYSTARDASTVDLPGVIPLQLDITDPGSVAEAAAAASDVTLLLNNAGVSTHTDFLGGEMENIRLEMETHYFGTLGMVRAFAPVLARNGGGAVLNVLSVLSWLHFPNYGAYSAAKAAAWAMTNVVRQELASQNTDVTALHVGYMDTDMADYVDPSDKVDPANVARQALDGIEVRALEVVADGKSRNAKAALSKTLEEVYQGLPVQR